MESIRETFDALGFTIRVHPNLPLRTFSNILDSVAKSKEREEDDGLVSAQVFFELFLNSRLISRPRLELSPELDPIYRHRKEQLEHSQGRSYIKSKNTMRCGQSGGRMLGAGRLVFSQLVGRPAGGRQAGGLRRERAGGSAGAQPMGRRACCGQLAAGKCVRRKGDMR